MPSLKEEALLSGCPQCEQVDRRVSLGMGEKEEMAEEVSGWGSAA